MTSDGLWDDDVLTFPKLPDDVADLVDDELARIIADEQRAQIRVIREADPKPPA